MASSASTVEKGIWIKKYLAKKKKECNKKIKPQQNVLEQWSLTGGRQSSLAISVFFIMEASSTWKEKEHTVAQVMA